MIKIRQEHKNVKEGNKYGHLTVLGPSFCVRINVKPEWLSVLECDCGFILTRRTDELATIRVVSCGCTKTHKPPQYPTLTQLEHRRKINPKTGCWEWTGSKNNYGYGQIRGRLNGKQISIGVHRYAYNLLIGKIPEGLCVCHHCDNPLCFNPKHLFAGTQKENSQDMVKKGRSVKGTKHKPESILRGSQHGFAKLTEAQVSEIRNKYIPRKYSTGKLAVEYGVNRVTIFHIISNHTWKHIISSND